MKLANAKSVYHTNRNDKIRERTTHSKNNIVNILVNQFNINPKVVFPNTMKEAVRRQRYNYKNVNAYMQNKGKAKEMN